LTRPYARKDSAASKKIQWKKVGERMIQLGASYRFGPGTCAKQWQKIKGESEYE